MGGSTIESTVSFGITLGGAAYASPLTITDTGAIAPALFGATGLSAAVAGGYVLNQGQISGGIGLAGLGLGGAGYRRHCTLPRRSRQVRGGVASGGGLSVAVALV